MRFTTQTTECFKMSKGQQVVSPVQETVVSLELDYNLAIRENQLQGPGFIDRLSCSIVIISLSFDLLTQSAVKK